MKGYVHLQIKMLFSPGRTSITDEKVSCSWREHHLLLVTISSTACHLPMTSANWPLTYKSARDLWPVPDRRLRQRQHSSLQEPRWCDTLDQCWLIAGSASVMLAQHWASTDPECGDRLAATCSNWRHGCVFRTWAIHHQMRMRQQKISSPLLLYKFISLLLISREVISQNSAPLPFPYTAWNHSDFMGDYNHYGGLLTSIYVLIVYYVHYTEI